MIVPASVVALLLAGCGSGGSTTTTAHKTPTTPRSARQVHRAPAGAAVGATQRVHAGGSTLTVRVSRVIDPLRGSGATLPPGDRAVAVFASILNHGPAVYDSSSTTDISLAVSSGFATPVYAPQGACQTQLRNWDNYIVAQETRAGCVSFAVADHATVKAVRFSPHGQAAGRVSWRVR